MQKNIVSLVEVVKALALATRTTWSVYDGDVYENWNSAEVMYGSVNVGLESITYDDNLCTYRLLIHYGDRLLQDGSNANEVYADAIRTLQTVVNGLNSIDGVGVPAQVVYVPFEQKFMDNLAGAYAHVDVTIESELGECGQLFEDDWRLGDELPATLT